MRVPTPCRQAFRIWLVALVTPSFRLTFDVKLCGRSRVATAARRAGCRDSRMTEICSRRDAALVLFARGASAPGRSRAAPA